MILAASPYRYPFIDSKFQVRDSRFQVPNSNPQIAQMRWVQYLAFGTEIVSGKAQGHNEQIFPWPILCVLSPLSRLAIFSRLI